MLPQGWTIPEDFQSYNYINNIVNVFSFACPSNVFPEELANIH
jgi:hypothetical protein